MSRDVGEGEAGAGIVKTQIARSFLSNPICNFNKLPCRVMLLIDRRPHFENTGLEVK